MRVFLLLTLCSVAAFFVVLRTHPELANIDFSDFSFKKGAEPPEPPKPSETKKVKAPAANRRRTEASSYAPSLNLEVNTQNESKSQNDRIRPASLIQRIPKATTVASDSVAVYSSNSLNSRILRVLNKGDQVETSLAVLDSEGNWSLIRVPDQRISGYVLSENLAKATLQTGKPIIP